MKTYTLVLAIILIILVILNIFQYYQYTQPSEQLKALQESYPRTISELKGPERDTFIGKNVTVQGYLVNIANKHPILVSSLEYLEIDTPIPDEKFLELTGLITKDLLQQTGAFLQITGTLIELEGEITLEIVLPDPYELLELIEKYRYVAELISTPWITRNLTIFDPHKYAVLISGGANSPHLRYWNDMKAMYSILTNAYNYNPNHIYVIYKDGNAEDTDTEMPVDYSASIANVTIVFNELAETLTDGDQLFVFTNNHGGGFNPNDYAGFFLRGGEIDLDGDEPESGYSETAFNRDFNNDGDKNDVVKIDETLCMYSPISQDLRDDDLASLLDNIQCDEMIIFMKQCFSGGFIHDLSASNRIIMTACDEEEFGWSADTEGDFGEFSYHFMRAVNEEDMSADVNNDQEISMVEAFNYASQQDSRAETPHYDDNGDQVGHEEPIPNGGDGTLGANAFL